MNSTQLKYLSIIAFLNLALLLLLVSLYGALTKTIFIGGWVRISAFMLIIVTLAVIPLYGLAISYLKDSYKQEGKKQ